MDLENKIGLLSSFDIQKQDFFRNFSKLSNKKFHKQNDGLLLVYPELNVPLNVYFLGSISHLVFASNYINLKNNFDKLEELDLVEEVSVSFQVDFNPKFSVLKEKVMLLDKDIKSFYGRINKFLKHYFIYVFDQDFFEKTKRTNAVSFDKKYSLLSHVLFDDGFMKKMFNEVTNPEELKYLENASWYLFESALNFIPKNNHMVLFNKSFEELKKKSMNEWDIEFYRSFLFIDNLCSDELKTPLNHFKNQHHDEWLSFKIKNYFS